MATRLLAVKVNRIRVRKSLFAITFLWSAAAASVHAQETGSLVNKYKPAQLKSVGGPAAARAALEDYAACQVGRQPARLAKLLTVRVDTAEYVALMNSLLGFDACISSGTLVVTPNTHRGALFQALYNREFKKNTPIDFKDIKSNYRELYPEDLSVEAQNWLSLLAFSECVVRSDPTAVRDLMRSLTGASSEDIAFMRIGPNLNACMPEGKKLTFSKSIIKGLLAESIYRLSLATKQQSKAQ